MLVVVRSERCFSDPIGLGDGFCLDDDYNKLVLPVDVNQENFSEPRTTQVNFTKFYLTDILKFDTKENQITLSLDFWLSWKDNRIIYLKNYTGSGSGFDEIWKPDLAVGELMKE